MHAVFRIWKRRKLSYEAIADVSNRDPVSYLFRGPSADKACGSCSRIVVAHEFIKHNIKKRRGATIISDYECRRTIARYEKRGVPARSVKGEMRGTRPFAWVTKTAAIDELRRKGTDLATEVRDQLGMIHYYKAERLVEIVYPSEVFAALQLTAPTFIEGSSGIVFRSAASDDGWGRAVNLKTLGDGLPEAVHPPEVFTGSFKVRSVGAIGGVNHNFSWDDLVGEQWNDDDIQQFEADVRG